MKLVIGNDHAAVEIKQNIIKYCIKKGYEITDLGVNDGESVDYPDKAEEVCIEYLKGDYDLGFLCCGTGVGISIAANKVDGIRCALPQNSFSAGMAKEHNDANVFAFGGRIEYSESLGKMLDAIFASSFQEDRHLRRVNKITDLEK